MRQCTRCKELKSLSDFSKDQARCKPCKVEISREWRLANPDKYQEQLDRFDQEKYNKIRREKLLIIKEQVNGYKRAKGCYVCGETDPIVLDFHHLNSGDKEADVAQLAANPSENSQEKLWKEIDKCVVICTNDHRRLHAGTL